MYGNGLVNCSNLPESRKKQNQLNYSNMQFESEESCFEHLDSIGKRFYEGPGYGCTGTFDNILCFEATPANYTLKLPCPKMAGVFDSSSKKTLKVFFFK